MKLLIEFNANFPYSLEVNLPKGKRLNSVFSATVHSDNCEVLWKHTRSSRVEFANVIRILVDCVLKCDGTRAETRFRLSREMDESI